MEDFDQLPASARDLYEAAHVAMAQSYSPYSNYPVGAAIRTASGRVFAGCNVENASYPLGTCAEAGAIAAMVLAGERQIVEVVTITEGERAGTPCGGCRQRLREFAALDDARLRHDRRRSGHRPDDRAAPPRILRPGIPRFDKS